MEAVARTPPPQWCDPGTSLGVKKRSRLSFLVSRESLSLFPYAAMAFVPYTEVHTM